MQVDPPDYYALSSNGGYVVAGKALLNDIAERLQNTEQHDCAERVLSAGGTEQHEEICALLGFAMQHPSISFTETVLAAIARHRMVNILLVVESGAERSDHPQAELISTLKAAM